MKQLNVAIIGTKFMGRAHSNGWIKAPLFFKTPFHPVLKVACARHEPSLKEFAQQWGWSETETDWKKVIERDDIDIIDIALPQHLHHEVALAAAHAGKHIFCEKPIALSVKQAEEMNEAAEKKGITHYLNHNYRRVPAVALAKRLIEDGSIGRIYHWRCAYQQDWIVDPQFPLTWQLRKEIAFAGPQWDLNSHSVDLAHFLVGPIRRVSCLTANFITSRPLAEETSSGNLSASAKGTEMGPVTVEDAALMHVEFANGAIGSFEATRFAGGRKNHNTFEIYGSKGSLIFDMERMNELQYYSQDDPEGLQGFRTVQATHPSHPYMENWWPTGHIIGYEHGFVHAIADFLVAIDQRKPVYPNFQDGIQILKVLEAGLKSAESRQWVDVG